MIGVGYNMENEDDIEIEEPMNMSYRESYAWSLGWNKGHESGLIEGYEKAKGELKTST